MKRKYTEPGLFFVILSTIFIFTFQNCGPAKVSSGNVPLINQNIDLGSTGGSSAADPTPSPAGTPATTPAATPPAVTPTPTVTPTPVGSALVLSASSIDLGTVFFPEDSALYQVVVLNSGKTPISITSFALPLDYFFEPATCYVLGRFEFAAQAGMVLNPGESCNVNFRYAAFSIGTFTGNLVIVSNDIKSPHKVAVTVRGR